MCLGPATSTGLQSVLPDSDHEPRPSPQSHAALPADAAVKKPVADGPDPRLKYIRPAIAAPVLCYPKPAPTLWPTEPAAAHHQTSAMPDDAEDALCPANPSILQE